MEGSSERNDRVRRRVGLVYDERMCNHHTPDGDDHPECPDRIRVTWDKLRNSGLLHRCVVLNAKKAEDQYVQSVHSKRHVDLIRNISSKKFDSRRNKISSKLNSIYLNKGSSEAAYLAAGSVLEAAEQVAKGELHSAFAIVRPPGHHAEEKEAMGFCLFNNVAVAARYLLNERQDLGIHKILIVDWDVHHGNATQKMFWKDSRVLFFSVHRHDFGSFYPGTDDGSYNMIGEGPGEGYNINVPWEQGSCGDADYFAAWDYILTPVAKEFNPDMIIISAGFDAAVHDPLGGCCVSPYGYSVMLRKLMDFAQGKVVLALEGGYNLQSLANSVHACVQVLLDEKPITGSYETHPMESTWRVIENVRKKMSVYWSCLSGKFPKKLASQIALDQKALNDVMDESMNQQKLVSGLKQQVKSVSEQVELLKGESNDEKKRAEDERKKAAVVPGPAKQLKDLAKEEHAKKRQRTETIQDQLAKAKEDALKLRDSAIAERDAAIALRDSTLHGQCASESALNTVIQQKDEALTSIKSTLFHRSLELMFCEVILRHLRKKSEDQVALNEVKSLQEQEQAQLAGKYTLEDIKSKLFVFWDGIKRFVLHTNPHVDWEKVEQAVIDGKWRQPVKEEMEERKEADRGYSMLLRYLQLEQMQIREPNPLTL